MNDYDVGLIFQDIELQLIKSMKRNLLGHELEEMTEGFKWEQWQAKKLRELRKFRKQNTAIMQNYKSKLTLATKKDLMKQYLEGGRKVDKEIKEALKRGYLAKRAPNNDFFTGQSKKLDALIKSINNDMSQAQTAALRMMDDVYRKTIFKSEAYVATGATTVKQAVDMATRDFLAKGINCITYKNGRQVNIASYAQMAIRTANKRVHLMGEGERRKEWGESLVLVSQYAQCSPLCVPWQGKVYIDDVYSGGKADDGPYQLLSVAIAGDLFHPNCKHTMSTYFEGINQEPKPLPKNELTEGYENAQRKNYINQNIRKYERLKEGSVDETNIKRYGEKIKEWKTKKKKFIQTGGKFTKGDVEWWLRRDDEAEKYYNLTRDCKDDIDKIAQNTGWSKRSIEQIKNHVFYNKHVLRDGSVGLLDVDYNMSVAWQRLINGNYQDIDILLLKHEYLESTIEKKYNLSNLEAHRITDKKHPWDKQLIKERGEFGEDDCLNGLIRKE